MKVKKQYYYIHIETTSQSDRHFQNPPGATKGIKREK
jgi:hypothetical protein